MNNAAHSLIVSLATLSLGFLTPVLFGAVDPEDQFESSQVYRLLVGGRDEALGKMKPTDAADTAGGGAGLVIGDTPGEVLIVSGVLPIEGDLEIVNDGRVEILPTGTLRVNGGINVYDTGVLTGIGGRIEFEQSYSYESQFLVWDQGLLDLDGTVVDGDGFAFSIAAIASVVWAGVEVEDGFATWALFLGADVSLSDVTNAGEFLQLDASALSLVRCETVLFWLTLTDGSSVDTTLPSSGEVALFEINESTPWATGLAYTTRIEACTDTLWAMMAREGSSAIIRDSELRVVGSLFERDDTIEIVGLANGVSMTDSTFSWGGIEERFVNTTVQTWNFYARGGTDLSVRNCIFGEIFSDDQASVWVEQSICDGSGGHIELAGQGQMYFLQSLCLAQVLVRENSVFIAGSSSFASPIIDVIDDALVAFINSPIFGDPRAGDRGTIFEVAIDPLMATRGDLAPITGSARTIAGPASPYAFVSYDVEFFDGQAWVRIDGPTTTPIAQGVLAQWDTGPVAPGEYPIRLALTHSGGGDPVFAEAFSIINPLACPVDLNGDGVLNFFDVSAFLSSFGAGNLAADLNGDGVLNFFDVSAFLTAFAGGCP
jgi:hypothetical protein